MSDQLALGIVIGILLSAAMVGIAAHRIERSRERNDSPQREFIDGLRRIWENDKEKNP